jgi:hypothetical protein
MELSITINLDVTPRLATLAERITEALQHKKAQAADRAVKDWQEMHPHQPMPSQVAPPPAPVQPVASQMEAPTEQTEAPTAPAAEPVSLATLQNTLSDAVRTHGRDAVIEVLKRYGSGAISSIPEASYAAVINELSKL